MQAITTIGLDIAKSVFQVHSINSGHSKTLSSALLVGPKTGQSSQALQSVAPAVIQSRLL